MSIASTQAVMRYTEVSACAEVCGGCAHAAPVNARRMQCALGGFYVSRRGWCRKYTRPSAPPGEPTIKPLASGDFEVKQGARIQIGPTDI